MKTKTFLRSNKFTAYLMCFALLIVAGIIVQSCKKQSVINTNTLTQSSKDASTIVLTKQQALTKLNNYFTNEFSPFKMNQVSDVNNKQFTQWLRNGQMADAENSLSPVLSTSGNEYVIIKNVWVKEAAQYASVGLIATTPPNYGKFTRLVAVINYNITVPQYKHICSWRKCDSYEPCPCVFWLDMVSGPCPTDKCIVDEDCAHFQASDCDGQLSGTTIHDVLETL